MLCLWHYRAEPGDIETATAVTAAPVFTERAAASTLEDNKPVAQGPLSGSGPGLPIAIIAATATEAEMVPVPATEQRVTQMPGPGVNAAVLARQEQACAVGTSAEHTGIVMLFGL